MFSLGLLLLRQFRRLDSIGLDRGLYRGIVFTSFCYPDSSAAFGVELSIV